ncbi:SMI1/KNR4 family protein [Actinoplanes sp. NPDC026623]|uniref:SMI1/KNR4 family protein n=1 Tax=Actinoplanes sp. NPDC026623 TaxID=3155610 RepID=UPI0033EC05A7
MDFDAFSAEVDGVLESRSAKGAATPPFDAWIASDGDLARVEAELRVRLPEQYRRFMRVFGAGQFLFLCLDPVVSPDDRTRGLVELNSGDFRVPGFVAVAPVATGDSWGFVTVDGVCEERVSRYCFEEEVFGFEAEDFLSFVSWQGLHAGREGY